MGIVYGGLGNYQGKTLAVMVLNGGNTETQRNGRGHGGCRSCWVFRFWGLVGCYNIVQGRDIFLTHDIKNLPGY